MTGTVDPKEAPVNGALSLQAPVSWSFILRALFNALVPECSLRLNNLRIPSYVLIKQLILNQSFSTAKFLRNPSTGMAPKVISGDSEEMNFGRH